MLNTRAPVDGSITQIEGGYRLSLFRSRDNRYRFAQLDDYFGLPRKSFVHRRATLSLRARASSDTISGTWGFGLWNDPFGFSLGFGGDSLRLPILPNAVWFFHASPENYLSFKDNLPGEGFLAQVFRAPSFHPLLIPASLVLPFSRKWTRKILGKVIQEDSRRLMVKITDWHDYKLEWSENGTSFFVDNKMVLETPVSAHPPLGAVIWIDNQYASYTPQGKIGFGVLETPEPEWLDICDVSISD